ncbi:ABC transporter ATP-binding protein [Loigolactobacillus jiayinensis]|uniref:ABC transporter ATP-binding protein n=1 Tax=Loigolactobacillus jiayinensis TaxID=2486016 RepID=A0ABW1RF13_9LACO|nr:ABC transporter ATP-binding protein [Loigolactobacillus jiayinensis]
MAGQIKLAIDHVSKTYQSERGETTAIHDINLKITENEFVTVIGPSGCGKSTLLNIIAGLEPATDGKIICDGQPVQGTGSERGVVFQQYALFPWLTVRQNVAFGLKMRKDKSAAAQERVNHYIEIVGLSEFADRYPKELSGGMRQRVAIARAYAANPAVLLMDEPFGALDAQTRGQLQEELLQTWEKEQKTCFFITHDVDEAILLGQKIVIMNAHPGTVKEVVAVDLDYPRNQETRLSEAFLAIKKHVWAQVYSSAGV